MQFIWYSSGRHILYAYLTLRLELYEPSIVAMSYNTWSMQHENGEYFTSMVWGFFSEMNVS